MKWLKTIWAKILNKQSKSVDVDALVLDLKNTQDQYDRLLKNSHEERTELENKLKVRQARIDFMHDALRDIVKSVTTMRELEHRNVSYFELYYHALTHQTIAHTALKKAGLT